MLGIEMYLFMLGSSVQYIFHTHPHDLGTQRAWCLRRHPLTLVTLQGLPTDPFVLSLRHRNYWDLHDCFILCLIQTWYNLCWNNAQCWGTRVLMTWRRQHEAKWCSLCQVCYFLYQDTFWPFFVCCGHLKIFLFCLCSDYRWLTTQHKVDC